MKVLIIGEGGREHAIAECIKSSPLCEKLYVLPGNAGIDCAKCIPGISVMDFAAIAKFARLKNIDIIIIGPDDPLAEGITDYLLECGFAVFGPTKRAAEIESSKVFSKNLMKKYNIPTAEYEVFECVQKANEYLQKCSYPIVIKADGLAKGKGVIIALNKEEALLAAEEILQNNKFGKAGSTIVIEEFLQGKEVSLLCICDGENIVPLQSAMDHKRIGVYDVGANTGGMGTVSPVPFFTKDLLNITKKTILQPTINAMKNEGRPFMGVLFVGLIVTNSGVKVLEYNARFGDPESQVVLPLLEDDLLEILVLAVQGKLQNREFNFKKGGAACIIMASGGYPAAYNVGYEIKNALVPSDNTKIFYAGVKSVNDRLVTAGGRVLGVTAVADNLDLAIKRAYENVSKISFENSYYRTDIGEKINI